MRARSVMECVRPGSRTSSALLITLLTMGLMTIIVVAFLGTMSSEVTLSRRDYDNQRARALATLGMNTAVAQLRNGLGIWDNPFVNFTNKATATYYWSVSPGLLTRWSYTQTAPATNYPLFSVPVTNTANGYPIGDGTYAATTNLVNLNAPAADGSYPIAGGTSAPNISVYWVNVLQTPNQPASQNNQIIGRYAYWVDDENAKININTADGTLKYSANSLGLGTPSEVDLRVLQQGGSAISTTTAQNIVSVARTTGFNSPREILRATGTTADLYTNNSFYLTTFGRAPELNIWGEPKFYCIPAGPGIDPGAVHGNLETNEITGQALTEIYPTPGQLSPFGYTDYSYSGAGSARSATNGWIPEVFTTEWTMEDNAFNVHGLQGDREGWMMADIALHLGGTNAVGLPITWPTFPGANGTNFINKYSLRQLDCISAEITDEIGKDVTPELTDAGGSQGGEANMANTVPSTPSGVLSHEIVIGLGRFAKINEIYFDTQAYGSYTNIAPNAYVAPYIKMGVYVETFFPAGFGGVDLDNLNNGLPPAISSWTQPDFGTQQGAPYDNYCLNRMDNISLTGTNSSITEPSTANSKNTPPTNFGWAWYVNTGYLTNGSVFPAGATTNNYWAAAILRNDQGIDFQGNPSSYIDPDYYRAKTYHSYLTNNVEWTNSGKAFYSGNGPNPTAFEPILSMGQLNQTGSGKSASVAWYPGQYRTVESANASAKYFMTNADAGTTLHVAGGLVVTSHDRNNYEVDFDPTPLEAGVRWYPRGLPSPTNPAPDENSCNGEYAIYSAWRVAPGNTSQTTDTGSGTSELVRNRVVSGAIPVTFQVAVPPATGSLTSPAYNEVTYDVSVPDPLVNKFAADWVSNAAPTMGSGGVPSVTPTGGGGFSTYYGSAGQNPTNSYSPYYQDMDSFWLPPLDPTIPRSARFPNIGYLNYIRTGVIPDDETVPVQNQHGTPFRCLNLNAAGDSSQTLSVAGTSGAHGYPDWAMLDMFTVPSTLLPYGGPYGFYQYTPNGTNNGTAVWTGGTVMTGNPTNMYYYGTWGGSTPGRINPNGAVIYTTNVCEPTPGITRTLPLQALLHGLTNNVTISSGQSATSATVRAPSYTGGALVDDAGTAKTIANYLQTNTVGTNSYSLSSAPAPFREPAEICNLLGGFSAVSTSVGGDSAHYNPTRNDLVRQIVGNLTTQSNVFSIWVAGQTITKSKANNVNYGIYEPGDLVTSSVRYHFVVERFLDPGADGIYGNSLDPAPHYSTLGTNLFSNSVNFYTNYVGDVDGIVGTYDDPVDSPSGTTHPYHPPNPRYLYHVVYAEEIRD